MTLNANPMMHGFTNKPILMAPETQDLFAANMAALAAHPHINEMMENAHSDTDYWPASDSWKAAYRPYIVKDGILQIPVKGILLHDFDWQLGNWATGYNYIWRAFKRGMEDDEVKGIAFIVNSPGGMVAGCFDAVDKMVALKGENSKPVRAFAQEYAYSAAYAVIMVADPGKINISRTGGVGSIGVVTMHLDASKAMDERGYKYTFIHAGKHKVDGNAFEPLPEDVKARIQERIDELYQVFVSTVARGRDMDEQAVRDTEALTFTANQALSNGLADNIATLDDALTAFVVDLSNEDGENMMSKEQDDSAAKPTANEDTVTTAQADADKDAAVAAAKTEERQRVGEITGCDEAKDRAALANHIAMNTGMSVEDAKTMLAAAPKATPAPAPAEPKASDKEEESGETPFENAMGEENPDVGANGNGNSAEDQSEDGTDVVALAQTVGLKGFDKQSA